MNFSNTNRDTTFNLANVCLNLAITSACLEYKVGALADVLLPVLFVALASMNRVSFVRGIFFSKEGNDLSQKLPKKFNNWITLSVIVTVIAMFMDIVPFGGGLFASFITILSSYFMLNHCPISIIASNNAWKHKKVVFGIVPAPQVEITKLQRNSFENSVTRKYEDKSIFRNSPAYRNFSGNKWHRF